MVRIFKTDIQKTKQAKFISRILSEIFPKHKINFDLEDCDNILRIEGTDFQSNSIIQVMEKLNYICIEFD